MDSKIKLLVIGMGVHPTGYTRVIESVLLRLRSRYDVHQLAINYRGAPRSEPWHIYPNLIPGDLFGRDALPALLERVRPQLVWIVHDLYMYEVHAAAISRLEEPPQVVFYTPIEGSDLAASSAAGFAGLDRLALYNSFARTEVERALAVALPAGDPRRPAIKVIPHGVDLETFRPLVPGDREASRREARRRLFAGRPELADAFLVLNANRNNARKRIDLTLEAFAAFARDKPPAVQLYLHMGMRDGGPDLLELARRLGIENRLLTTTSGPEPPEVSDKRMNLIYNACDVGVNTSTAEGWGLIAFEHAATGAAQIVPRHTACADLWQGAALLVEPCSRVPFPFFGTVGHLVAPADVAAALERLYGDPALLRDLSVRAHARATDPVLTWDRVAECFDALFQDALGEPRSRSVRASLAADAAA